MSPMSEQERAEQIRAQHVECERVKAFLVRKSKTVKRMTDAAVYCDAANMISAYQDALDATLTPSAPVAPPEALRALVEKWRKDATKANDLAVSFRRKSKWDEAIIADDEAAMLKVCADELSAALSTPSAGWASAPADKVWIVSEWPRGGIRAVVTSLSAAEAEIAAIRRDHPDLKRSDFSIHVERVRRNVENSVASGASVENVGHRCSACGHRWGGLDVAAGRTLTGAELCGDCWRKAQPALHASTPSAGWQVIETAKQDGRAIIGLTWNGEVMPVYWHRGSEMSQPGWRHAGDGWRSGNAPRIVKWHQWPAPPAGPAPEKE